MMGIVERRTRARLHPAIWVGACSAVLAGCGTVSHTESDAAAAIDADSANSAAAAVVAPPRSESTLNWTWLGGDSHSNFHARDEHILSVESAPRLQEVWVRDVGSPVNGAAVVIGEHLYISNQREIAKLDAETGDTLWRVGPGGFASLTYDDGMIYAHGISGQLYARNADDGNPVWSVRQTSGYGSIGFSSPLIAGDYVILGISSGEEERVASDARFHGEVVAFEKDTGEEAWRHQVPDEGSNGAAVWSSPSVDLEQGVVYVATGNNYTELPGGSSDAIIALDLATGERLWTSQLTEGDVYTSLNPNDNPDYDFGTNPILLEAMVDGELTKLVAAGQKSGVFYALRRDTGQVVWSREVSGGSALGGIMNNGAWDGERVIVAGHTITWREAVNGERRPPDIEATMMALDPGTGEELWKVERPGMVWAPIVIANGVGLVAFDTTLVVFEAATGDTLFEYETGGSISSAPVVSDGWVFFGSGVSFALATPGRMFHALKVGP